MTRKTRFFVGMGAAAVLMGAFLASSATLGADTGQTCDKEWGCKGLDAVCLEGEAPICSLHCESDDQCPTDWACGQVKVLTFDGKSEQPEESATAVCLPK